MRSMPSAVYVSSRVDSAVLVSDRIRVEVTLRPFSLTIRRDGRSRLRAGGAWLADGSAQDVFLQFTEGVVPVEDRSEAHHAVHGRVIERRERGMTLAILLED